MTKIELAPDQLAEFYSERKQFQRLKAAAWAGVSLVNTFLPAQVYPTETWAGRAGIIMHAIAAGRGFQESYREYSESKGSAFTENWLHDLNQQEVESPEQTPEQVEQQ